MHENVQHMHTCCATLWLKISERCQPRKLIGQYNLGSSPDLRAHPQSLRLLQEREMIIIIISGCPLAPFFSLLGNMTF